MREWAVLRPADEESCAGYVREALTFVAPEGMADSLP